MNTEAYEISDEIKHHIEIIERQMKERADELQKEFTDRFCGHIAFTNNDLAEFDRKVKYDPMLKHCQDRIIDLLNVCPRKYCVVLQTRG